VEIDGERYVRGHIRVCGRELFIRANSERRYERLLTLVKTVVPRCTLVEDRRRAADDVLAAGNNRSRSFAPLNSLPAHVLAAMNAQVRRWEQSWLDEPLPAFEGRTPREAADDPTRREDVLSVLLAMQQRARAAADHLLMMDPERLRADLGL
jgi:hypothetical protein